jgi:hypothetical protein
MQQQWAHEHGASFGKWRHLAATQSMLGSATRPQMSVNSRGMNYTRAAPLTAPGKRRTGMGETMQDRAFWITWYDLPEEGRDAYLEWCHEIYMPKVQSRPGVLWGAHYASESNVVPLGGGKGMVSQHATPASLPDGDRYILVFGATEPHVFMHPSPTQFHASLADADRRMLAMRIAERSNTMLVEATVLGPEAKEPPDLAPSAGIQLGSFNAGSWEDEEEMAAWYAQSRFPSLRTVPGFIRARKLVSVAGWAKHACFYEFTSVAARNEYFVHYQKGRPELEEESRRIVGKLVHAPKSANLARRIWPAA